MKVALISDTHGTLPKLDFFDNTDVIIHAGDVGPDHDVHVWQQNVFKPWLEALVDRGIAFYGTLGNHDMNGPWKIKTHSPIGRKDVRIVIDEAVEIGGKSVWFSPWSPTFGSWAWMANEHSLMNKYMKIPLNTDVIVSHTPPWGDVGGMTLRAIDAGSLALRLRIEQMIPDLVVCGHIHEGYGQHVIPLANGMVVDVQNVAQMDLTYSPVNPPVWVEW